MTVVIIDTQGNIIHCQLQPKSPDHLENVVLQFVRETRSEATKDKQVEMDESEI